MIRSRFFIAPPTQMRDDQVLVDDETFEASIGEASAVGGQLSTFDALLGLHVGVDHSSDGIERP